MHGILLIFIKKKGSLSHQPRVYKEKKKGIVLPFFSFPLHSFSFRCSFTFDIGENNKKATRRCNCLRHNSSGIEKFRADVDGC